jgi:hypothetical protein
MALVTDPAGPYASQTTAGRTGVLGPLTGRSALLGITQRGPIDRLVEVDSYATFKKWFGGPISNSSFASAIDWYFRLGGGEILVGRNAGLTATAASVNIPGASGTTLILTARDVGDHANAWEVDRIVDGTNFRLVVRDENDATIADTGLIASRDDVPDLLADNQHVSAEIGAGTGDPTAGTATAFTGGANGTTNDASAARALALIGPEYGTLQVCFPGDTSSTRHEQVKEFCVPGDAAARVPVVDHADASASTTATAIEALWDVGQPAYHCVSIATAPKGLDQIPGSIALCAAASLSDAVRAPGHALAADNAQFPQLGGLVREFNKADRVILENAGATYMTLDDPDAAGRRVVQIFSDRVGTDPLDDEQIYEGSDLRVLCAIDAEIRYRFRPFRFDPLVPETLTQINTTMSTIGVPFYEQGVISDDDGNGSTGRYEDAFSVTVAKTGLREVTVTASTRPSPGAAVQRVAVIRQTVEA